MARASKGTTLKGFVNRNEQRNNGLTDPVIPGNDHCQSTYQMECLSCGHKYGSNGSDIFQRKCPKCQGGATGVL